jgi:hypothetical protein
MVVTALSCTVPTLQRDELADGVAVADHQLGRFALVLLVLVGRADGGELEDAVVAADGGVAFDHHVRGHRGAGADLHVRADHGVGPRPSRRVQLRLGSTMAVGWNLAMPQAGHSCAHRAHQLGLAGEFVADAALPLNL